MNRTTWKTTPTQTQRKVDRIHRNSQPGLTKNQTTSEWTERSKYKTPILSDRETDLTKINPKMWWEQKTEYIHLTYSRNHRSRNNRVHGPTHRIPHKKQRHLGARPKSQTRNYERPMGPRIKRRQSTGLIDIIQENIYSGKKRIP